MNGVVMEFDSGGEKVDDGRKRKEFTFHREE
ncbi:hypothetical protein A2U01_0105085, partial [Trifolium medium]|nr:hypothetical protein [Trifolium medium]